VYQKVRAQSDTEYILPFTGAGNLLIQQIFLIRVILQDLCVHTHVVKKFKVKCINLGEVQSSGREWGGG
jgi:hypothetical protein